MSASDAGIAEIIVFLLKIVSLALNVVTVYHGGRTVTALPAPAAIADENDRNCE